MTARGFAHTLADYSAASRYDKSAADRLPMGEHGESMRHTMNSVAVAVNWRANVGDKAHTLRQAVKLYARNADPRTALVTDAEAADVLAEAARALLHALGESEGGEL